MTTPLVELVLDARATLGEGPCWDPRTQRLYWVDILAPAVHVYDPATGDDQVIAVPRHIGCLALRESGGAVVALQDGFAELDLESGQVTPIPGPGVGQEGVRFNDGKCDPSGRFWAGTMAYGQLPGAGALYCLDTERTVRLQVPGVTCSNGLTWSLDGRRMYYIDTPTHEIAVFDYDCATGAIANRRIAVAIPPAQGLPDGMTIDGEGMLWVAFWGGHAVARFDPERGRCLEAIPVPVTCPSSVCFGGPQLDELYITSASVALTPEARAAEPEAGGLFCVRPGVCGVAMERYRG
jgi:sugar lactone lactonase YvrE